MGKKLTIRPPGRQISIGIGANIVVNELPETYVSMFDFSVGHGKRRVL